MDPAVFQFIGEMIENATNAFITPAAAELMNTVKNLAVVCVALYITLTGYAIVTGAIQAPFWTFMKQCMKIVFIAFFAFTAHGYTDLVIGALKGLETGVADAMSGPGGPTTNIYQVIDKSMGRGFDIVGKCFEKAHAAGWNFGSVLSWALAGIIVALGTVLIAVLGGAVVIVAKFSLAIVFALGPLFIFCLMFPATAKFFDSWFSQALNYIITIVIMAIIMTFVTSGYNAFIDKADFGGTPGGQNPLFAALQIGALTGVFVWIILQASGLASGLVGGVSMAAMGIRHLATPVTSGLNMAKSAGRMVNPTYTKRDMASGMMTTNSRVGHMIAGNTAWNPAYRQQVFSNMGKNWGYAKGGSVNQ